MVAYKASGKEGEEGLDREVAELRAETTNSGQRQLRCLTIGDTCPKGQLTGPSGNLIMSI
jgi:hypothetical protein